MSKKLETAIVYLGDPAFAASFQTIDEYRQAVLKAIASTQEAGAKPAPVEPSAKNERHLAQRGAAVLNARNCMNSLLEHEKAWSYAFSDLAKTALEDDGNDDEARRFRRYACTLDEMKDQAESALNSGMFCVDPDHIPNGSWLWTKLMDWCKAEQVAPANYNSLFAICGEAHALSAAASADAKPATKQS
jgi:hypothetical protein